MHLKMSSVKWRPFCLGLNVLMCYLCMSSASCSVWGRGWSPVSGNVSNSMAATRQLIPSVNGTTVGFSRDCNQRIQCIAATALSVFSKIFAIHPPQLIRDRVFCEIRCCASCDVGDCSRPHPNMIPPEKKKHYRQGQISPCYKAQILEKFRLLACLGHSQIVI